MRWVVKDFGKGFNFSTAGSPFRSASNHRRCNGQPNYNQLLSLVLVVIDMIKNNPKTALAIAGTGIAGLAGIDDEE